MVGVSSVAEPVPLLLLDSFCWFISTSMLGMVKIQIAFSLCYTILQKFCQGLVTFVESAVAYGIGECLHFS